LPVGNLRGWFGRTVDRYSKRILPFDAAVASIVGEIGNLAFVAGRHPGFNDVAISAIADA
jgi:predicted nucleic acid-binding protein